MNDKLLEMQQNNAADEIDIPDEPGPALLGKEPVIGSVRRSMDAPVVRDELKDI